MKFGSQLSSNLHQEWKFQYVDYDELKRLLKSAEEGTGFGDKNEALFVQRIESELDKEDLRSVVSLRLLTSEGMPFRSPNPFYFISTILTGLGKVAAFCTLKSDEVQRRVEHVETRMDTALAAIAQGKAVGFEKLEEETSRITGEVAELSRFIRLNYSAFMKILKKHDKHTSYMLKSLFMIRLQAKPFYKLSFDSLIIRLSKIYDTVRTGGKREPTAPPSGSSQSFVRRTTKYWVHPDNVTEVKIHILKNLPVLIFANKGSTDPDPAITSIYLDNDAMELYVGRLEKSQGAEAHRIRWYGSMDQTEIFFERKTHQEDWTGESSVKTRFSIKEKNVNDFMSGKYTMDKTIEKMRARKEKSDKELDDALQLSREIQNTILTKGLKPMVRTFYNRTAFQLPGDARVRISLDTELTMIREDNYEKNRSGNNWRRLDAGTIAPFDHLPEEDVCEFPYAVLEVKLQTHIGTTPPQWVQDLINSHLVEEVPKFSKFIHGCATLLENRVPLLPFWLPQMDKDIRKPIPDGGSLLDRPKEGTADKLKSSVKRVIEPQDDIQVKVDYEDDDHIDETTPLIGTSTGTSAAKQKVSKKIDKGKAAVKVLSWFSADTAQKELAPGIPAKMNGKKIVLPVRVEPKVFFANERTFLSWLHFCVVLGGLALGLLNFDGNFAGQISGLLFTGVAMMFMMYALFLYQWRADKIRNRDPGPYDDRVGPTVLVITLFCVVLINFYLKFVSAKNASLF